MNAFASYRAINAKLSAKKSSFFTKKEWEKMVEFESLGQFIDFLKKHESYRDFFNMNRAAEDLHRGDLELLLGRFIVAEIEQILHYFSGPYKSFFKILLMEYEINDLQLIIRSISRDGNKEAVQNHFLHSEKFSKLPYQKLTACSSIIQFVETLKGTIYYDSLKTITQEDAITREFHMEMKLYILFYRTLMEKATHLSHKDKKIVEKMIGMKIDLMNVQWVYRAIKYYDISPEEILIYSLPYGEKIDYKILKKLCYTKSIEDLKQTANKYLKYELFEGENDTFLGSVIDGSLYRELGKIGWNNEDISTILSYIYQLSIELKDLVSVTESIRYSISEDALRNYLAHTL